MRDKPFLLLSLFQKSSNITEVMEEIFKINVIVDLLRTWSSVTSLKTWHRYPLKTTSYIYHNNHSTRGPFLRTQLRKKTAPKKKNPAPKPELQGPPTQHPRPQKPRKPRHPLSHWNGKSPFKSQNPQTNQKIISTTSHVTFTYPPTLQRPLQQKHMPSFIFPTIFPRTVTERLGIIPQKLEKLPYLPYLLKALH